MQNLIILKIWDYIDKITNFINDKKFTKINRDNIYSIQNMIRKIINSSKPIQ